MVFYQLALRKFGNFSSVTFSPLDIATLVRLSDPEISDKEIERIVSLLAEKAEMMDEYFGVAIENGTLTGMPYLCLDYYPQAHKLPKFIHQLATKVDWLVEKQCFKSILQIIAQLYVPEFSSESELEVHVKAIMRAMRSAKLSRSAQQYIHELVELNQLYRIFERC